MKVAIVDAEALHSPLPRNIRLYLRSRGWQRAELDASGPDVWQLDSEAGIYEVIAPSTREARDYQHRVAELLRTLSIVEDRSQLGVLRDWSTLSYHIQYVHTHPGGPLGTAPLASAAEAFTAAEALLASAAATLEEPKLILPPRRPTSAVGFMKRVLAGPTSEGSYILSLWVPIPPRLTQEEDAVLFDTGDDPFERTVTRWLNRSLDAARLATKEAMVTDAGLDAFIDRQGDGVSANLLEAVAALSGDDDRPIEVSFAWSLDRPVRDLPPRVAFAEEFIPVLRDPDFADG